MDLRSGCVVAALVCFLLGAANLGARVNLIALGLALCVIAYLL